MKPHLPATIRPRPGFGPRLSDAKTLDLSRAIYCLQFLSLLTHQILCTGHWRSLCRWPTACCLSCCWHLVELSGPTFSAHKGPRLLDFPLWMSTLYSFVFRQCHFSLLTVDAGLGHLVVQNLVPSLTTYATSFFEASLCYPWKGDGTISRPSIVIKGRW